MKILILNWRDLDDPKAGGAELLTHEVAKRLVEMGHQVVQHNSFYQGARKKEIKDGVEIVRHGNYLTTYFYSSLEVLLHGREYDVIIEEVHGIPYFAPFLTSTKVVTLALEIAKGHWSLVFPFPINLIGYLTEKAYFLFYRLRRVPFLTISPSSKRALMDEGIKEDQITIIPMGLTVTLPSSLPDKAEIPTIIFLGRLSPVKGIEDAIKAFIKICESVSQAQMWIVGSGDQSFVEKLKKLVIELGVEKKVKFWGFVSESEKFQLLAQAHLLVVPSKNEGWGLIVPEAGRVGTPAIVYNVPGLRDVVIDGRNGLVAELNSPENLAELAIKLLKDKSLYRKVAEGAEKISEQMNWDKTTKTVFLELQK
jgi:glycosyltransferase involved in cell wall biosynthesis